MDQRGAERWPHLLSKLVQYRAPDANDPATPERSHDAEEL